MSLRATSIDTNQIGYFRIFAQPPGGRRREITMFRGAPIVIESLSSSDPFTDSVGSLSATQITVFDTPGAGDLDWLVPDANIDVVWQNTSHYDYDWSWEGYIASYDFSFAGTDSSFTISMKGALYALDDYVAKPTYPRRPIPYELLIDRQFDQVRNPAGLAKLKVTFPDDWNTRVPDFTEPSYFWFLKPWVVTTGQLWSGLASRNTGAWEQVLTGYIQGLLGVMFDQGNSQWTIRNRGHRRPELFLRRPPKGDDPSILTVQLGAPGVEISGSRDFTQSMNVVYGQGTDLAGVSYNGMTITQDGRATSFQPFAYAPQVYPRTKNPMLDPNQRAKEKMIQFQDALDEPTAHLVARTQLQRFSEPGITGTVTLSTDPLDGNGKPFPRMLLKAGVTLRLKALFGNQEGFLAHVTQVTADFNNLAVQLTFDTKYRDALTVEEVQARTRDALDPVRALQVGKYQNLVNDLVLPWSYPSGSGVLPSGSTLDATQFFMEKIPSTATFPYEEWTQKYPPKYYPNYYIKIGPTDHNNATNNWAWVPDYNHYDPARDSLNLASAPLGRLPIRMRMAQAGTIRLSQIAAYDKNGNIMPVRFHISIYANNGSGPRSMPQFPSNPNASPPQFKWLQPPFPTNYQAFQSNPFYENAWETVEQDGTQYKSDANLNAQNAQLVVGWGNYFEPAGYYPGRASRGATRTGLLSDAAQWQWQFGEGVLDLQDPSNNANMEDAGMLFVNIYCDEQGDQPVYFMGRFFRVEPGTT